MPPIRGETKKIVVRTKIQQILLWPALVFMPLNIAKTEELR